MRRSIALLILAMSVCACSNSNKGAAATTSTSNPGTIAADDTSPIPGGCGDNPDSIDVPTIVAGSTKTPATYGQGSLSCGSIAGDGYIVYSYNPTLIDTTGAIQVVLDDGSVPTFNWAAATFTKTSTGHWKSSAPTPSCDRLTIMLTSASGAATATYGADIRVGGAGVDCPQRDIDPSDPSDTDSVPPATPPISGEPPITAQ
ncbi:MAG TPA: hypothetical protein VGM78_01665 [Ilumatobacteraceae bacterium]